MKTLLLLITILLAGIVPASSQEPRSTTSGRPLAKHAPPAPPEEEAEIRKLIESLVISDKEARTEAAEQERANKEQAEARKKDGSPDPFANITTPPDVLAELRGYAKARNDAFDQLTAYGELAFPLLAAHLDDERPSRKHWNHTSARTVGRMCYRIVHDQLTAFPPGYGEYGRDRLGRDGKYHQKSYWGGTPYDENGGLGPWLNKNQHLGCLRMRIKCLEWQLAEEKKIGASNPGDYYNHIQPLELEILKLKASSGQDVAKELERAEDLFKRRPDDQVPKNLLPEAGKNYGKQ